MKISEITYSKEQVEEILNIINTIPFQSIDSALKIAEIFKILNSPFTKNNAPTILEKSLDSSENK